MTYLLSRTNTPPRSMCVSNPIYLPPPPICLNLIVLDLYCLAVCGRYLQHLRPRYHPPGLDI